MTTGTPRTIEPAKRLVMVALNELNFDLVARYVQTHRLPSFEKLLALPSARTRSEEQYEKLEPWIQWVSVHTGLAADQHGIFRLGDIVGTRVPQIFEQLEQAGHRVGSVCAMNAENRLRAPAYFVPDPWTRTPSDGSFWSTALGRAVAQAVNDNADGRIEPRSLATLLLGLARFASPRHYPLYLKLALGSRGASWRKALFLDLFLHDLHRALQRRARPAFSTVFFNAGAHVQHHYFFNAKAAGSALSNPPWYVSPDADPFADMLEVYDVMLADYLADEGADLIVATGLTQKPYDRIKFYWRLRDHADFLRRFEIPFVEALPRMTRDFLVTCRDEAEARVAVDRLAALAVGTERVPLFGDIDNRGSSVFVTLTYPHEITDETQVFEGERALPLRPHVAFVAIKNGMHSGDGYSYYRGAIAQHMPQGGLHVNAIYGAIREYFALEATPRAP